MDFWYIFPETRETKKRRKCQVWTGSPPTHCYPTCVGGWGRIEFTLSIYFDGHFVDDHYFSISFIGIHWLYRLSFVFSELHMQHSNLWSSFRHPQAHPLSSLTVSRLFQSIQCILIILFPPTTRAYTLILPPLYYLLLV